LLNVRPLRAVALQRDTSQRSWGRPTLTGRGPDAPGYRESSTSTVSCARGRAGATRRAGLAPPGASCSTAEPLCKILAKQITRSDILHATALWGGSTTSCAGVKEQVAAELAKRLADPGKVPAAAGQEYGFAASGLCRADSPALKKKGLDLARQLAGAKIPDVHTRNRGLKAVVECDPKAGAALATTLLKDKAMESYAKSTLSSIKEQAKKK
jgi:hypothetical protein